MPSEHADPDRPLPHLAPTPRRHGPRRDHLDPRNGRFLDPASALRFDGQALSPTPYAGDTLLFRPSTDPSSDDEVLDALGRAATREGCVGAPDDVDADLVDLARRAGVALDADQPLVVRFRLRRTPDEELQTPPDAWRVLQRFRQLLRGDDRTRSVQLAHLLTTSQERGGVAPSPYIVLSPTPNPYIVLPAGPKPYIVLPRSAERQAATGSDATAEYAQPGWGGRTPVTWVGPAPARRRDDELRGTRRPVVAVLDTGAGAHPWLGDDVVDRAPRCAGRPIGITDPDTDVERLGVVSGRLTGSLDVEAGHGTFIAGLVLQRCPDARILAVRVVQPDGVVDEYDLLAALNMLWLRQELAVRDGRPDDLVDVVSLSLGYYHEEAADALVDPLILAPLRALGRLGVSVVASAGNDATSRPMYPAAFAPWSGGLVTEATADEVPLVAVGATNPDGSIALFSNDGPWVRAYRPGAGLVSTMPTTFDGGRSPSSEHDGRSTIDPDDFRSGFATWSGTSFAAPILAGDVAQCLNEHEVLREEGVEVDRARGEAWAALSRAVPGLAPG